MQAPTTRVRRATAALCAIAIATLGLLQPQTAGAAVTPAGIEVQPGNYIERPNVYDYGASILQEGNTRRVWWCGQSVNDPQTDAIFYREQDVVTGAQTPIQEVLTPNTSAPSWDRSYICDPSVIGGAHVNPDDGQTYRYAMYYTATDRGPGTSYWGSPLDGTNNRIGIAYSNDGVSWTRYSANPVIYPASYPTDTYGAGQAATQNGDGAQGIRLMYTDFSIAAVSGVPGLSGEQLVTRAAADGRNFSTPQIISHDGIIGSGGSVGNGDLAFDYVGKHWYLAAANGFSSPYGYRPGERERFQFGVYRMTESSFPNGTWEHVATIDTNLTGHTLNHNTALVRDFHGNVNPTLPYIETIFSQGDNSPSNWDLGSVKVPANPDGVITPMNQYKNGSTWYATTGSVPGGFSFHSTVGDLYVGKKPGTVPLYNCVAGSSDFFTSPASNCEGQRVIGINGFIYEAAPSGIETVPLYRCNGSGTHWLATVANCGGGTLEQLLGYILAPDHQLAIQQGSFETPATPNFVYAPTGSAWAFAGTSGVQRNGSAFGAPTAPQGSQTALLQSGGGGLGSIAQTVQLDAGRYRLAFDAAKRADQLQPVQVYVDGNPVGSPIQPSSSDFGVVVSDYFQVGAGAHSVELRATNTTDDKTTFVDSVRIVS